jgi:5-methylcytosine-specific restriction endonuclease McrA
MSKRNYIADYSVYSFKAEDEWGCYKNGKAFVSNFDKLGYAYKSYKCDDGEYHTMFEHTAKWEYFYGIIPEGMVIDHIIPISIDGTNKLSSLRIVTQKGNCNNENSIENYKNGNKNKRLGKHHSNETKKKLSEINKGKTFSEETIEKLKESHSSGIIQINTKDGTKTEWMSCKEVHDVLGYNTSAVAAACRGEYSTHKGHEYKGSFWFKK